MDRYAHQANSVSIYQPFVISIDSSFSGKNTRIPILPPVGLSEVVKILDRSSPAMTSRSLSCRGTLAGDDGNTLRREQLRAARTMDGHFGHDKFCTDVVCTLNCETLSNVDHAHTSDQHTCQPL